MNPKRALAALVVALVSLTDCAQRLSSQDCTATCSKIGGCGLLPSAFGTDFTNCEERCQNSDVRGPALITCAAEKVDPGATWCTGDSRGCDQLSKCMMGDDPSASVPARGTLRALPTQDTESARAVEGRVCDPPGCEPHETKEAAEAICQGLRVSEAAIFWHAGDESQSATVDCVGALSKPPIMTGVPAGPTRVVLVLRGAATRDADDAGTAGGDASVTVTGDSGDAGAVGDAASAPREGDTDAEVVPTAPGCFVYVSSQVVVHAGTDCTGIHLSIGDGGAGGQACEQGAECEDGIDNDGDGYIDCADYKCADVCKARPDKPPGSTPIDAGAGDT